MGANEMKNTLPDSIVNGLKILALSVCQPKMVTGISPARHPMVNKAELKMIVAHHIVAVVLLKAATCWGICILLYLI